jgi:hypothetical protein
LSLDGVGEGFAESSKPHTLEFKTMNEKNFAALKAKGVKETKPVYWAQCQIGMHLAEIDRCVFLAVNKNTDELYSERVEFDPVEFAKLKARAERVIRAAEPPMKISNDPSWYVCKLCSFHEHCHGNKPPKASCRTCAHATPEVDGDSRWSCAHHNADIPLDAQRKGCDRHRFIPVLLEKAGAVVDVKDGEVVYESGLVNGCGAGSCSSRLTRRSSRNCAASK